MDISTGLMYMLFRRSNDSVELQRQQLNLLREHQGLPPIPSRHDNPTSRAISNVFTNATVGIFAGMAAIAGFAGGLFVLVFLMYLGIGPQGENAVVSDWPVIVWLPVGAYGAYLGWKAGAWAGRLFCNVV
jgi:hypothetical protein